MRRNPSAVSYFRNFIFGVEDSLVSTVGLLSGIAIAHIPRETIFLTGLILIFVEAFSMAAGTFLSEYSAEEYARGAEHSAKGNFVSGAVMFFSYFVSGFVPLVPYAVWPVKTALVFSILFSVIALFTLGIIGAKMSGTHFVKNGLRMAAIGSAAIIVGLVAGILLR
ncbi:hypothetical protein A2110_01850 [Candidatus Jorgensenbacteria bacterium GWA1_54_12]|uniref:VIT family protein n=1 Tax=Candidatus Jorgensenbacteria bacterium GWA1_54_12 TaxID=1798468 RepID=A0A1F6BLT2_9BACT|nr:MAG: hypothetical protein A2110_01850 [Candidatus Jorgensenbacteria bacterium GWA1_54_12]